MKHYLLDTHIAIWYIADRDKLGRKLESLLSDSKTIPILSLVSYWEIAIKMSLDKLRAIGSYYEVKALILQAGFETLDIKIQHIDKLQMLPFHHRDPFDRLLVAQSLSEQIPIISADASLDPYFIGMPISRIV
jgi:PIN domain nuclease of toxin-antitoxin system